MVKLNPAKKRIGYFSNFMGGIHFFEMDLLSGDFAIKSRLFPELVPNFYWLKDNNSIVMLDKVYEKNKWNIGVYNNKTDLFNKCLTIKGDEVQLTGLSPNGKDICVQIKNRRKDELYRVNLQTKKLTKIFDLENNEVELFYWASNNKLFFVRDDINRYKIRSIWSINIDGTNNEPFFEEIKGTNEEIIGITANGKQIALNIYDKGIIRSGILEIETGEIQYLPSMTETIQAISSTGKEVITADQQKSNYYFYKTNEEEKWLLPIDGPIYNMGFCIDDEFLIYTKYNKDQPTVVLFDLVTLEKNYLFKIENNLVNVENEFIIL